MFRATLFDYNGVLVDDEALHFDAFRATLAPLNIPLSDRDYAEKYMGFDDVGVFEAVLRDVGRPAPEHLVRQLVEDKKPHYLRLASKSLAGFPEAARVVKERAACGPVVVVSGALRAEIELGLDLLGVRGLVEGIVAAEDTTRCKPDPQGYEQGIALLRGLGLSEPERESFVIEDSLAGVEAARAVRLPCLAVCHSYEAQQLRDAGATLTVPRIGDVDAALVSTLVDAARA